MCVGNGRETQGAAHGPAKEDDTAVLPVQRDRRKLVDVDKAIDECGDLHSTGSVEGLPLFGRTGLQDA